MKVLDLFSGIGGFSMGLERAGMETIAFCEKDEACQGVLKKHWPHVIKFKDIKDFGTTHICAGHKGINAPDGNGPAYYDGYILTCQQIDVVCGGYPCTGHSLAGKKKGFENEASGLWKEFKRVIGEVRPKFVIIENSANLRSSGLVELLKDLWEIGYHAEWSIIPAYAVGAPHQRERIYIVAWRKDIPYCNPFRPWGTYNEKAQSKQEWWAKTRLKRDSMFKQVGKALSKMVFSVDGLPRELVKREEEKIKQLGNAVVPQIVELIGRELMKSSNT